MFNFGVSVLQVTAEAVMKSIGSSEDFVILDVRTPEEFSKSRINESINVPVDLIENRVQMSVPDKRRKIFVYCLSGSRSALAVDSMIKLGYSNVFSMTSGLLAWRANKYPLETK